MLQKSMMIVVSMCFILEDEITLYKGESVLVVGASTRRGHLVVDHNNCNVHVPYQYLEFKHPGHPLHPHVDI